MIYTRCGGGEKPSLLHFLGTGIPEELNWCSLLTQNSLKLELTISNAQSMIWLIERFKRSGENQREHISLQQAPSLCAGCRVPSVMGSCSGYSLLVLWQIAVIELSWSLTNFHWLVCHGGEPSSVTPNFPHLITANQECEEKHFLWVSGAQQAGQPTCGVRTSVCLSRQGEWCTLQILQHVKAAESPINVGIGSGNCVIPLNFLENAMGNFVIAKGWNWPISAVIHLTVECVAPAATDWPNMLIYWNHQTISCHVLWSSSPN